MKKQGTIDINAIREAANSQGHMTWYKMAPRKRYLSRKEVVKSLSLDSTTTVVNSTTKEDVTHKYYADALVQREKDISIIKRIFFSSEKSISGYIKKLETDRSSLFRMFVSRA